MDAERIIKQLESYQLQLFVRTSSGTEPADPTTLSSRLLLIRALLLQLVDHLANSDRQYRLMKAARLDGFLEKGMKKSPAIDQLEFEEDLIELKVNTERLRNYIKYVDGLCSGIQSVLKVQIGSDKNQY